MSNGWVTDGRVTDGRMTDGKTDAEMTDGEMTGGKMTDCGSVLVLLIDLAVKTACCGPVAVTESCFVTWTTFDEIWMTFDEIWMAVVSRRFVPTS